MPKSKKALDLSGVSKTLKKNLDNSPAYISSLIGKGIGGSRTSEPVPGYSVSKSELVLQNGTNAYIVLGKDRPSSKMSGYGGRGDSGAGTLDIIVGRMAHNPTAVTDTGDSLQIDPNFKVDASRIYISQKTDVDLNFDLAKGKVTNSVAKAAIALKSDAIRIIAREGVKIITGTDVKNSGGEDIVSVSGIDLIAGNDDSNLQPISLGDNLNESLNKLVDFVDNLAGIVSSAITYQMKYNAKIAAHTHISPFFGVPTAPSEQLIPAGIEVQKNHAIKTIQGLVKFRTNLKFHKQTFYAVSGTKYINSSFNNTN